MTFSARQRLIRIAMGILMAAGPYRPAGHAYAAAENIKGPGAADSAPGGIRVLAWWDYIAPDVDSDLKAAGFRYEVATYRANEKAISRLTQNVEGFDVAILSNLTIPVLSTSGSISKGLLAKVRHGRQYLKFTADAATDCVPYLWSSTIFVYDSRFASKAPESLRDLVSLKKMGAKIAIIDDPYEVVARGISSDAQSCPADGICSSVLDLSSDKTLGRLTQSLDELSAADFRSSVDELLREPKVATYGWHGAAGPSLVQYPWLKAAVASPHPVIGFDAVCILSKGKSGLSHQKLVQFVERLTNRANTTRNVRATQYFSPYLDDVDGLAPPLVSLYRRVVTAPTSPVFLTPPHEAAHSAINRWWRQLRYEKH